MEYVGAGAGAGVCVVFECLGVCVSVFQCMCGCFFFSHLSYHVRDAEIAWVPVLCMCLNRNMQKNIGFLRRRKCM